MFSFYEGENGAQSCFPTVAWWVRQRWSHSQTELPGPPGCVPSVGQLSRDECVTMLRTSLGKLSPRRLPQRPGGVEKSVGRAQSPWERGFSGSWSKHFSECWDHWLALRPKTASMPALQRVVARNRHLASCICAKEAHGAPACFLYGLGQGKGYLSLNLVSGGSIPTLVIHHPRAGTHFWGS